MEHEKGTDLQRARALAESVGHFIEEDAAELSGLKMETLAAKRKRGEGPAWVRWGNRVMYPREAIREYLQGRVKGAAAAGGKAAL